MKYIRNAKLVNNSELTSNIYKLLCLLHYDIFQSPNIVKPCLRTGLHK